MEALSSIGSGPLYYVIFICIFNYGSRSQAFYYILFIGIVQTFMNIGKMVYHEPRPYMTSLPITPLGCSPEYGNPSGHQLYSSAFFTFMFLDIFHGEYRYGQVSKTAYYLSYAGTLFVIFMMGFSRLYTGLHTLNQIIYGIQVGMWLAYYFNFCFRQDLMNHIDFIAVLGNERKINYKKYIVVSTITFVVVMLI